MLCKERALHSVTDVAIRKIANFETECTAAMVLWVKLIVKKYLRTLGWDRPNSRSLSRQLLHVYRFTDAFMTSSLAGVRTVHERPEFTRVVGVNTAMYMKRPVRHMYACLPSHACVETVS
jgi:hypothetical protein